MASKRVLGAVARASVPTASTSRAALMSTAAAKASASDVAAAKGFMDFEPVKPLPPTHRHHVATLQLRAHTHEPLDLYTQFALRAARNLRIPTSGAASLPTTRELVTVIKSHFVHKKTQENFEARTHRRAIKVYDADRDALDLWLRYLKKNAIGGVGMKAYIHEYVEYGFASGEVAEVEGMLGLPENEVEKAAEDIIKSLSGVEFPPEKVEKKEEVKEEAKEEVKAEAKEEAKVEAKEEAKTEAKEEAKVAEPAPAEAKSETEPKA